MTPRHWVRIALSGPRAEPAARDLFSSGWFEAELERRTERPNAPASCVCAQVVAIGGGSVTIADKLVAWWERWGKAEEGSPLEMTLESSGGLKLSLATASRDDLVQVLRILHLAR
jgi:hypothetical protein